MPRVARVTAHGVLYHLIWRFVDRSWFFTDDHERWMYLQLLERALRESDWECMAYALMSSHIHIAAVAGREPLARWALRVSSPFARWMNHRHARLGPVIADRPKSCAAAREREPYVVAYIHNNPVRAGVVTRANESTWTSHRLFAGSSSTLINTAGCLDRWEFSGFDEFDAWVTRTPGESGFPPTRSARKAARLRGGVEMATPVSPQIVPIVARPFAHVRLDPRLLVAIASHAVGATVDDVGSRKRNPQVVAARFIAVALADRFGVCGSDIAAALGMSPSSICYIRRRVASQMVTQALQGAILRVEVERAALIETRPFQP